MGRKIQESEYAALAEFRYRIRLFLHGSDETARAAGLEPQQYQLLLAARAFKNEKAATIRRLAERLQLRHHSVVGLVDRLEVNGYVRRERSGQDQREVLVTLLPRGQRALERVVLQRLHELRDSGHTLVASLTTILNVSRSADVSPKPRKALLNRGKTATKRSD
jgi:DNA-binding MarR family transcriptional regulator